MVECQLWKKWPLVVNQPPSLSHQPSLMVECQLWKEWPAVVNQPPAL
jgi:hypothetical protein